MTFKQELALALACFLVGLLGLRAWGISIGRIAVVALVAVVGEIGAQLLKRTTAPRYLVVLYQAAQFMSWLAILYWTGGPRR